MCLYVSLVVFLFDRSKAMRKAGCQHCRSSGKVSNEFWAEEASHFRSCVAGAGMSVLWLCFTGGS